MLSNGGDPECIRYYKFVGPIVLGWWLSTRAKRTCKENSYWNHKVAAPLEPKLVGSRAGDRTGHTRLASGFKSIWILHCSFDLKSNKLIATWRWRGEEWDPAIAIFIQRRGWADHVEKIARRPSMLIIWTEAAQPIGKTYNSTDPSMLMIIWTVCYYFYKWSCHTGGNEYLSTWPSATGAIRLVERWEETHVPWSEGSREEIAIYPPSYKINLSSW